MASDLNRCAGLFLDQVCRQGPQRPQLSANQRQLCLHQPLMFIQLFRHLLQGIGQRLFGIAVNRHR